MLYQPLAPNTRPPINWQRVSRDWLRPMTWVLFVTLVINLFFPRYSVEGHSMEPGLHETERIFSVNIDLVAQLERGQLLIARSPVGEIDVVKRLIGLPGETVEVRGGTVYIDGVALDEPYIDEAPRFEGVWVLGPDEYFVLGDNRNRSTDSADYGPLPRARLEGIALLRFWPLTQAALFTPPSY